MRSLSENPEIGIKSDFLTVDKKRLAANVLEIVGSKELVISPEEFARVLSLGREAIHSASLYRLRALRLGDDDQSHVTEDYGPRLIFSQAAFDRDNQDLGNHTPGIGDTSGAEYMQGVFGSSEYIQDQFHPYWEAVEDAGYQAEIRSLSGKQMGGAWMMLYLAHE